MKVVLGLIKLCGPVPGKRFCSYYCWNTEIATVDLRFGGGIFNFKASFKAKFIPCLQVRDCNSKIFTLPTAPIKLVIR